jgi:hypothetical protein
LEVSRQLSNIPQKKQARLDKKVLPHLKRAFRYANQKALDSAERELKLAASNYRKENIEIAELHRQFAGFFNDLGAFYANSRDFDRAFQFFLDSIDFAKDTLVFKKVYENLLNVGLGSCKFDELLKVTESLSLSTIEKDLKEYLKQAMVRIKAVENNEPYGLYVTGFSVGNNFLRRPLPELIYLPNSLGKLEADFSYNLTMVDHATIDCSCVLSLSDLEAELPLPYQDDAWKVKLPPELASRIPNSTPNFTIFLTETEHIPINQISIRDSAGSKIDFEFVTLFGEFHIPDSYSRFGYSFGETREFPLCKSCKYFRGKVGLIKWNMHAKETYFIELSVKNYQSLASTNETLEFRLGFLLPFKKVNYKSGLFNYTRTLEIKRIQVQEIPYFTDKSLAIALTAEPNSVSKSHFTKGEIPKQENAQPYIIKVAKSFDFTILGLSFEYIIRPETISIATFQWEQPVPTSLSHLRLDNRFGFPPLCQYQIVNNSKQEVRVAVKTEIERFTNATEELKVILPYSINNVFHTPLFNDRKVSLREAQECNFVTSVKCEEKLFFKKNARITILAFDTMLLEMLNPLTRDIFSLYDFLPVWVTPHTEEVERIISIAKENHPQKCFTGYQGHTKENIELSTYTQSEMIFLALKNEGITYVDSSLSFGGLSPYTFQRIKYPDTTIKTKSANCIDGAVLYSSLLEHIGIEPFIITVPGHAFVGWKPSPQSSKIVFLETTAISTLEFEDAVRSGKESLERGILHAGQFSNNPNIGLEEAINSGRIHIIDVTRMRKRGILPQVLQ